MTSEERAKWDAAAAMHTALSKNCQIVALEEFVRIHIGAGGDAALAARSVSQREAAASAVHSAAIKQASEAGAGASMMAELSREKAALKAELKAARAELAAAAATAKAAAAVGGENEGEGERERAVAAAAAAAASAAAAAATKAATSAAADAAEAAAAAAADAVSAATADGARARAEAAAARGEAADLRRSLAALRAEHDAHQALARAASAGAALAAEQAAGAAAAAASAAAGQLEMARAEAAAAAAAAEGRLAAAQQRASAELTAAQQRAAAELAAAQQRAADELDATRRRAAADAAQAAADAAAAAAAHKAAAAEYEAVVAAREAAAAVQAAEDLALQRAATAEAEARYAASDRRRMELAEEVATLRGAIRVFVRVRPASASEPAAAAALGEGALLRFPGTSDAATEIEVVERPGAGVGGYGKAAEGKHSTFSLQRVFATTATQADLFREVEVLVQSALGGNRVSILAYGQTGSGKTHTMQGCAGAEGLIPQSMRFLFERRALMARDGWAVAFRVEVLEIYNELVRDLLADAAAGSLDIKHDKRDVPYVDGLSSHAAESPEGVAALLARAAAARATGATKMNEHSSRSHLIVTLRLEARHAASGQVRLGSLNLVDLAGSERLDKSGAEGARKAEAAAINKSLSALSNVMMQLQLAGGGGGGGGSARAHVSYRDSKLTHVLQPALQPALGGGSGGASRTLMICALAPGHEHAHETLSTLRFAETVSKIAGSK